MKRTNSQNKRLHQLISKLGINEEMKTSLVLQFTHGRTGKSSEMEYTECNSLISKLSEQTKQPNSVKNSMNTHEQTQRRKVFSLFYDNGFIEAADSNERKLFVINAWIEKKMNLDKKLNDLSLEELERLIRQLQTVKRIYTEKTKSMTNYN